MFIKKINASRFLIFQISLCPLSLFPNILLKIGKQNCCTRLLWFSPIFSDKGYIFALLFCPLLHFPIYFVLKFCLCPCPLFCPHFQGKAEGKGKGKIWGQNKWGNEEEGKIKEGKNTKFIWKNKWWPKNLVQQSQFPTFNEMLWNILRGQKDIWKIVNL